MNLAEALSVRKDLQKRIDQLKARVINNVKVQEGDKPAEDPRELMGELDDCLKQLQDLIFRINATNMATQSEGHTLTEMMAQRDVLSKRIQVMREICDQAAGTQERYSLSEIKTVITIDVKTLHKQIDKLLAELRKLDIKIQGLNFVTEVLD